MTAHERLNEMKKFIKIAEGTWSAPQTVEQAKKLGELLSKPLPVSVAADKLYNLIGDDLLFDSFYDLEDDGPNTDVRTTVAMTIDKWLRVLGTDDDPDWSEPWDTDAIHILQKAIAPFIDPLGEKDATKTQSVEATDLPMVCGDLDEDDSDGMGSYDIYWNGDTWKEAIPYDEAQKEVERILQIIDDSALQAHDNNDHLRFKKTADGDTMIWTVLDPIDGDYQEIRVEPSDMPAGYTGESIELGDIVESVLEEYPGQPKDYYDEEKFETEQAERAKHIQSQAKEFEQDKIDSEIEDAELGFRFD